MYIPTWLPGLAKPEFSPLVMVDWGLLALVHSLQHAQAYVYGMSPALSEFLEGVTTFPCQLLSFAIL